MHKTLDKANVFDWYKTQYNDGFDYSLAVTKDGVSPATGTFCVANGSEGYVGLQAALLCSDGVLSDCSGSDSPQDGTAVRACGVRLFLGDSFGGSLSFKTATSTDGVPSYTDGRTSGASSLKRHMGSMWWFAVTVLVLFYL